ncbi:calcium-dependent protein kinase cdpk4a, partial [Cystoisospora suis]
MLLTLAYLHSHDVVHRDLRLEKWVFASQVLQDTTERPGSLGAVKLVDLGSAKHWINKKKTMNAACGTLPYASPDMLVGGYTEACDIWSLGVIAYMMLAGHPPFHSKTREDLVSQILSGRYSTRLPSWEGISDQARDFVRCLLDIDPVLRRYASCSKLKRVILTMMAYSVTTEEAGGLGKIFFLFCKSPTGTIHLDEFICVMKAHFPFLVVSEIVDLFEALDSTQDKEIYYNGTEEKERKKAQVSEKERERERRKEGTEREGKGRRERRCYKQWDQQGEEEEDLFCCSSRDSSYVSL